MEEIKEEPKEEPPQKKSILEETKEAISELRKEREEMSKIKDELQQLRSDQLLSGTAGGHIETMKTPEQILKDKIQAEADNIVNAFHRK